MSNLTYYSFEDFIDEITEILTSKGHVIVESRSDGNGDISEDYILNTESLQLYFISFYGWHDGLFFHRFYMGNNNKHVQDKTILKIVNENNHYSNDQMLCLVKNAVSFYN